MTRKRGLDPLNWWKGQHPEYRAIPDTGSTISINFPLRDGQSQATIHAGDWIIFRTLLDNGPGRDKTEITCPPARALCLVATDGTGERFKALHFVVAAIGMGRDLVFLRFVDPKDIAAVVPQDDELVRWFSGAPFGAEVPTILQMLSDYSLNSRQISKRLDRTREGLSLRRLRWPRDNRSHPSRFLRDEDRPRAINQVEMEFEEMLWERDYRPRPPVRTRSDCVKFTTSCNICQKRIETGQRFHTVANHDYHESCFQAIFPSTHAATMVDLFLDTVPVLRKEISWVEAHASRIGGVIRCVQ